MKYLILVLALITANVCQATELLLGQLTYHFETYQHGDSGPKFNEEHALVGLKGDKYAIIAMDNSFDKFSILAVRVWEKDFTKNIRGFAAAGLSTGYADDVPDFTRWGLTPMAYVGFDLHPSSDKYGLTFTANPSFVGLGLRTTLGK